ncbi:MAG TPA: hypothetical protein VGM30_04670 [Puia sp.]|jgi:hypothetical protein
MAINKQIKDWRKILLDTSILCALFRSEFGKMDSQTEFVLRLINYLSKNKTAEGIDRTFYVSAITISELLTREHDSEKIKRIIRLVNSRNVEFIDFDLDCALVFNARLYPHLDKVALHKMAEQVGFKSNDFMMAREWISRDYMIVMSGVSKNVDVIITADKKTFYPICQNINQLDCILAYPELFEETEQYILRYHDDKVAEFLKPPPPPPPPVKATQTATAQAPTVAAQTATENKS